MNERDKRRMIRENRRRLFLDAWEREKQGGASLSRFCRHYGLSRVNFYRWLRRLGKPLGPYPIRRMDPAIERKVLEIHHRYRGSWDGSTISLVLRNKVSARTVADIVRRNGHRPKPAFARVRYESFEFLAPDVMWSADLTHVRCGEGSFELLVLQDEASRFRLGWYLLKNPRTEDVMACLRDVFNRFERRPLLLKTDNAPIFSSPVWRGFVSTCGIAPCRIPPNYPRAQGKIERGMREIKTWLRCMGGVATRKELEAAIDEGMWAINFFKPKAALFGKTPAAAYFGAVGVSEEAKSCIAAAS